MRIIPAMLLAMVAIAGQSKMAFSQQPISKGSWTFKNDKLDSVTFDYGTELTAEEIDQISSHTSLTRMVMGYAGVDSEYVEIEGDLLKLGRLKNLQEVHLCKQVFVYLCYFSLTREKKIRDRKLCHLTDLGGDGIKS